jgi:diaminopropionate ammonia-lyase
MIYTNTSNKLDSPRAFITQPKRLLAMLQKCPAHNSTTLSSLSDLAAEINVAELFVKDESSRMGLGSFKSLGGAFAVAQMICEAAGTNDPTDDAAKKIASTMTFVTASAGNHGLSVAAGAKLFGANSVVILPETAPDSFAERISNMGANVKQSGSYAESVADAMDSAEKNEWIHLSDGSWEGYIERPALIMEGYTVLAEECNHQFTEMNKWPTHVFIQAGVGGLAASMAANIREHWPVQPFISIVEPDAAPCLLESAKAHKLTQADGPDSCMGRLDCKDASKIAFESLICDANEFITISDKDAESATEMLARHNIPTTPSGAAGLAGLIKKAPGSDSRPLIIVSEGA